MSSGKRKAVTDPIELIDSDDDLDTVDSLTPVTKRVKRNDDDAGSDRKDFMPPATFAAAIVPPLAPRPNFSSTSSTSSTSSNMAPAAASVVLRLAELPDLTLPVMQTVSNMDQFWAKLPPPLRQLSDHLTELAGHASANPTQPTADHVIADMQTRLTTGSDGKNNQMLQLLREAYVSLAPPASSTSSAPFSRPNKFWYPYVHAALLVSFKRRLAQQMREMIALEGTDGKTVAAMRAVSVAKLARWLSQKVLNSQDVQTRFVPALMDLWQSYSSG